ncbi:MAG TPA: YciI family protein, partial [Pyrinomonadaceae bacterium]|nr:YciI family protein [Pyrinomonadaceae bacterium]
MKYMLLIYHDDTDWANTSEKERQEIYGEYRDLIEDLRSRGKYLAGDELQPATTASSVRVREGQPLVTDGPFAETREQVGGFFMIEASDLQEATSIAARIPS